MYTPVILPGYEVQLDCDDAIGHSKNKLEEAANDLLRTLVEDGDSSNRVSIDNNLKRIPCMNEKDTLGYRCSCSFQLVEVEAGADAKFDDEAKGGAGADHNSYFSGGTIQDAATSAVVATTPATPMSSFTLLRYAMRSGGKAILINSSKFPIATPRIQNCMERLLDALNSMKFLTATNVSDGAEGDVAIDSRRDEQRPPHAHQQLHFHPYRYRQVCHCHSRCSSVREREGYMFPTLRKGLTSVSFVSSWGNLDRDIHSNFEEGSGDGDCVATLHYSEPLPTEPDEKDNNLGRAECCVTRGYHCCWMEEAEPVRKLCNLTALVGRSRGKRLCACSPQMGCFMGRNRNTQNGEDKVANRGNRIVTRDFAPCCYNNPIPVLVRDVVRMPLPRLQTAPLVSLARTTASSKMAMGNNRDRFVDRAKMEQQNDREKEDDEKRVDIVTVRYRKPVGAFQHPNGRAMKDALAWMFETISKIADAASVEAARESDVSAPSFRGDWGRENSSTTKPTLLEMYCGCGAHTVALALTKLLQYMVVVEIDQRLVHACIENCKLNNCYGGEMVVSPVRSVSGKPEEHEDETFAEVDDAIITPVYVCKSDAGTLARMALNEMVAGTKTLKIRGMNNNGPSQIDATKTSESDKRCGRRDDNEDFLPSKGGNRNLAHVDILDFDIMLVDPPRQGLDKNVCELAKSGKFRHLLYVSCGRLALIRDLRRFRGHFDVVDFTLLDLFPRTNAVETLVHLVRVQDTVKSEQ